jgi:hypothetical protein
MVGKSERKVKKRRGKENLKWVILMDKERMLIMWEE